MPPIIALWGALLFCGWAINRDIRHRPAPAALWVPMLWMMRCGSRSIDYWFTAEEVGRLDPLFVAAMIMCGLVILIKRRCDWRQIFPQNASLFVFYGFLCLSETWVDGVEAPGIKAFRPIGDLVMALVVATAPNPLRSIAAITRRTAFLLVPVSVVLIRYYHDLGTLEHKHWGADLWIGVTTHKNPLGQLCILSLAAVLWTIFDDFRASRKLFQNQVLWLYVALILYLLNGGGSPESRSTTSFLTFAVIVAVYAIIGRFSATPKRIAGKVAVGATSLAAIALFLQLFGTSLQALVADASGKDPTLTDRTYLWRDVVRIGMDHPILGSGYGGFWVPSIYPKLSPEVDNGPRQAHNGYLETFANLGLIGLALLAWVIFHALKDAACSARFDFEYNRVRLALLFGALVMNYAEATFTVGTHLWWFSFLIAALNAQPPTTTAEPGVVTSDSRLHLSPAPLNW